LLGHPACLIPCAPAHAEEVTGQNATPEDSGAVKESSGLKGHVIGLTSKLLLKLGMDKEAVKLYVKWIVGAPLLVVFVIIVMLLRHRGSAPEESDEPLPVRGTGAALRAEVKSRPIFPKDENKLTDKQRVLRFFFQLFKSQINADPNVPTELYLVEMRATCPNETYEMRVQQNGEWISRRMSIGLLGQGGGSRSKCFYVIYDSHMVIKLPAEPITSFFAYNRQIASEAGIVARLAPRECIVPRVSVILKQITSIPEADKFSSEEFEKIRLFHGTGKAFFPERHHRGNPQRLPQPGG
ncbi:MAG: hypothetical protein P8X55_22200, partial [Desulfosarcinaceae bacterium]